MTRLGSRSLLSDGMWLSSLQALAALGQLAGIRLLTQILSPRIFGEFSLLLGIVALIAAGIANPTMQAMLRYYPEYRLDGKGELVKTVALRQLVKLLIWASPVVLVGMVTTLIFGWIGATEIGLLVCLVVVEILRLQSNALLNASSAHRAYGVWAVADAWGRPLLAWLLVSVMGTSLVVILAGYLFASLCTWLIMKRFVPSEEREITPLSEQSALARRFWKYTLPLLPLGILGWVSGMADRFMIGAFLSPADVGLYVAIYGLASRPMLMFGSIVENIIRPAYQTSLVRGEMRTAHGYLIKWVVLILLGSTVAFVLACFGHHWLAYILLGKNYRTVSFLLPWLMGGYALLILSHIANTVCYANEATRNVLFIEASSAILAVAFGYLCIKIGGLKGAAQAVPLYYGVQLIVSFLFARNWLLNGRR